MSREPWPLVAQGVSRTYRSAAGSTEALRAVDARFPAGAISALVGPSGTGKSTLLRLLAGLDFPDGGSILAGDTDVTALRGAARRRYRRRVAAYVAQRAASSLIPQLTVREQLGAGADRSAGELGVTARLDARAGELSGGQQARAALAAGLARETPILLADEPTAELDRAAAASVTAALHRAAADGRTVVVATHDPELVDAAATVVDLGEARSGLAVAGRRPAPPGERLVAAREVSKRYGGDLVVDHASLEVAAGELGVLLGRSGSGKSTLLMMLAGFVQPDAGAIERPGLAWGELAYVAQRFGLLPELTIAENVGLPGRLAGTGGGDDLAGLDLELAPLARRVPEEVSVGQQQRTALARALAARPQVLLADEPTSHQDAANAERVWSALSRLCDDGAACLVATHDEAAAARANRVWRIEDGRVVGG